MVMAESNGSLKHYSLCSTEFLSQSVPWGIIQSKLLVNCTIATFACCFAYKVVSEIQSHKQYRKKMKLRDADATVPSRQTFEKELTIDKSDSDDDDGDTFDKIDYPSPLKKFV